MSARNLAVGPALAAVAASQERSAGAGEATDRPHSVANVESPASLIPPTMDGGRTEIEMGDVDGDGNLDLVSVGDHGSPWINTDQHGIMVWFGDGTGAWAVQMTGSFGYGGVALGDVNSDGLMDVGYGVHHDYSSSDLGDQLLEVALGDGSGLSWTPWDDGLAVNGETWGMFSTDFADVDSDGDLDVGSVSFGCCSGVHVYLNQGDGTWAQSFGFLDGNSDMHFEFGDVNGDGHADVAVSHGFGTVYLGDGAGSFVGADGNLPSGGSSLREGVALGDVNHDGADDLAFCNPSGGIEVWSWTGPGTWQDLSGDLPGAGTCEATQLHDMDVDGHLDVASFGSGQGVIWGGDGSGGWSQIASFSTPPAGRMQAFRVGGDADHNGYPDIVLVAEEGSWPSYRNRTRFFKESSAAPALNIQPVYPLGHETIRAGCVVFLDWVSAVPSGDPGAVSLELSTDGPGGPWQLLAAGLPDNGRYQWRVAPATPSTVDGFVRYTLTVDSQTVVATTPAPFNIEADATIFVDGFESGDTGAWSTTTP